MKRPADVVLDSARLNLSCVEDDWVDGAYVDVRVDTLPPCEGDEDYSESPATLRRVASWLTKAADWLEERQRG
jgi:hypothetical protein